MKRFGRAVNTHDHGLRGETAPHQRHTVDLREVAGRFIARPGEVAPDDPVWAHHPERIHSLWRNVDPTFRASSRAKKHVLRFDELDECVVQRVELVSHGSFHRYRFGEVPGLVDIRPFRHRSMIRQKLRGDSIEYGGQHFWNLWQNDAGFSQIFECRVPVGI